MEAPDVSGDYTVQVRGGTGGFQVFDEVLHVIRLVPSSYDVMWGKNLKVAQITQSNHGLNIRQTDRSAKSTTMVSQLRPLVEKRFAQLLTETANA